MARRALLLSILGLGGSLVAGSAAADLQTYVVQLAEDAVPQHMSRLAGLTSTRVEMGSHAARSQRTFDAPSTESRVHADHLSQVQQRMIERIEVEAGRCELLRSFQHAINGFVVRMSEQTAIEVAAMQGVRFVEPNRPLPLATASTPLLIGAQSAWNGSATGENVLGDGIVIGIIDSGINHGHPSFADVGGDGYDHSNPLGAGNYLGDCLDAAFAALCNDKLIGAYTLLDNQNDNDPANPDPYLADPILLPGQIPSADTNGHGTHVASTAGGNVLFDVPLMDADGNATGIVFERISGVAPHANLVAFKVCAPTCFLADITAAVDRAIADGVVDVLNHSIGSSPGSPWSSAQAVAFRNARASGIFVASAAGDAGPATGSAATGANAPWVASVAATTHDRTFPTKQLANLSGGDPPAPADITGRSVSAGITGSIVDAGDFPTQNGSANDVNPEQCLAPFPPDTFAGQVVVCQRGAIASVAKAQNVRDGGAGGFVVVNVAGGATSTDDDVHVLPAIHVDAADGDALRSWLASGTGHSGTITAVDSFSLDAAAADHIADFSSRGPYTGFDFLAPNVAAPGVAVLAGGAELSAAQIALNHQIYPPAVWESVPGEFGQISGTSTASPHVAGSAALMRQARPDWTDAEILSAIMSTATDAILREDGITPADPYDFGAGRVRIEQAIRAGLVLDETTENFEASDPDAGGEPSTLNLASLVASRCVQSCSWTRRVRATLDGAWLASSPAPWVSVSPTQFSLADGEVQTLDVTADVSGLVPGTWAVSNVVLTSLRSGVPATRFPATILVPEPSSLSLYGAAIAAVCALRVRVTRNRLSKAKS